MENLVRFLRVSDATSGAPVPPHFRPGMCPSRHRAYHGAMRNARKRRGAQ